jgi:hypothetical protein
MDTKLVLKTYTVQADEKDIGRVRAPTAPAAALFYGLYQKKDPFHVRVLKCEGVEFKGEQPWLTPARDYPHVKKWLAAVAGLMGDCVVLDTNEIAPLYIDSSRLGTVRAPGASFMEIVGEYATVGLDAQINVQNVLDQLNEEDVEESWSEAHKKDFRLFKRTVEYAAECEFDDLSFY